MKGAMWLPARFSAEDVRGMLRAAEARPPVSDHAAIRAAAALNHLASVLRAPTEPSVIDRREHAYRIGHAARALLAALDDNASECLDPAAMHGVLDAVAISQARTLARRLDQAAALSATAWDDASTKGGRPFSAAARAVAFHGAHAYHAALLRAPSEKEDSPALRFIGKVAGALGIDARPSTVARVIADMRAAGEWRGRGAKPSP